MAAGKGYDHVSAGQDNHMSGRSEMDQDPEGQLRGCGMTTLQTVPGHIAGILALSCWKRKLFPSRINLQGMWMKDFIYIALACK